MDLENQNPEPEFDLDSILKEFGAGPEEPPQEPVPEPVPEEPAPAEAPLEEPAPEEPAPEEPAEEASPALPSPPEPLEDTVAFEPVEDPGPREASLEETIVLPSQEDTPEEPSEDTPEDPSEAEEQVFIPSPSVYTPRSRLRELKKKLVSGPERRYYELSELGVGKLQISILLCLGLAALSAVMVVLFAAGDLPENRLRLVIFTQVLSVMLAGLLGSQLLLEALGNLFRLKFTPDTLLLLTFAACLTDGYFCLKGLRIPCCGAFCFEMAMALWARCQRRTTEMGQMDTMRKAVRLHGVVKTPNFYEGLGGLLQVEGEVEDFMDTYRKPSGPERVQNIYALVALAASGGIAAFAGMNHSLSYGVQLFSAALLAAMPGTFFISYTRPYAILEQRLHMVGSVLCGWQGIRDLSRKGVFPLDDADLFPQGSTKLNGVKFYGSRDPDEVVSYTASLILRAGGGLAPVFQKLLESRGCHPCPIKEFRDYGDGGIGCLVHGEPVLVGTMDFLRDMDVAIPEGTMVSQALYAAIDGELSGVYAISYAKMRSAAAGLVTLIGCRKLKPLILCHDFMVTEEFIQNKFGVKTRRMIFPEAAVRTELRKIQPDPQCKVLALSTREELVGMAYAVTGSRALRTSANLGTVFHLLAGILGLVIMAAFAYLGNAELLTPTNLLLYQLVWAVPGLLITEWTRTV